MNFDALLNSLLVSDTNNLGLIDVVLTMVIPFVLSFVISFVYRFTQKHANYSVNFVHTIFLFSVLSAIITLLIGSNIARAFGLVGALSIIRFRNALKEPIDAVYVFWALAVGMAAGTGFYLAAVVLVVICAAMVLILHFTRYGEPRFVDSVLKVFTTSDKESEAIPLVESVLRGECKAVRLINVIFNSNQKTKSYIYSLRLAKKTDVNALQSKVTAVPGIEHIHHLNKESSLFAD